MAVSCGMAAVASRRAVLRSGENAISLPGFSRLQRKFSIVYLLLTRRKFLVISVILCSHFLSIATYGADQNSPAFEAGITFQNRN